MTLPASGAISFNAINVELGVAGTTTASLGQTSYRNLAGVASGAISMSNFYGKANQFAFTIASNTTNANLRTLAVNAGWNQSSKVVATINSGVYVFATSTGTPALTINGSFPGGVQLNNNGVILGCGGNGGVGVADIPERGNGTAGSSGGLALSVSVGVSINNANRIAGGGGGGGGGGRGSVFVAKQGTYYAAGGGGGGGIGNSSGGAGGPGYGAAAGGPGGGGSVTSAGAGGNRGSNPPAYGGYGGAGGGYGASGASSGTAGGAAGGAVSGNGNITWIATGTRNGGIS